MVRALSYVVACIVAAVFVATLTFNVGIGTSSIIAEKALEGNDINISGDEKGSSYHYGVIIDAGSSGSRVFVYIWPSEVTGAASQLIKIRPLIDELTGRAVVKKVTPGLSTYGENTTGAVLHAQELLDYAGSKIPKEKHKETSLFLMATAGMRLIPADQQEAVLNSLKEGLPKLCDFIIMDQHIEIISGKWEGIYSWIAVNYALQRFDHTKIDTGLEMVPIYDERSNKTLHRKPTVGMIDMGGGSVQIAFETDEKVPRMQEHMTVDLNLGFDEHDNSHKYKLYVTTFLGFGANVAISRYETKLAQQLSRKDDASSTLSSPVPPLIKDPCLPPNLHQSVILKSDTASNTPLIDSYTRKGIGHFDQCQLALKGLLNSGKPCSQNPCSFDGMYQPLINFSSMEFYGFSEYWYSMNDVLDVAGPYSYGKFQKEASKFCGTKWSTLKHAFDSKLYPKADLQRMKTECIKAAWISVVLHDGFGFPRNVTKFRTVSQINNEEVQWTIGALLYRMRHFPLRELQRLRELQLVAPKYHKGQSSSYFGLMPSNTISQLLLFTCIGVVVAAAFKYICVLRRYKRSLSPASSWTNGFSSSKMPRNRSMYSYMTLDYESKDGSMALDGVRIERPNYIY